MFCILCMFCIENFLRLILQNITQPVKKKMLLLMIPHQVKEGWHYLAVKKLFALLKRKTSCEIIFCLYSIRTENQKSHEKIC